MCIRDRITASESSVTVQWTPVTNAAKYAISISPFSSGSYKLLGYFDNSRNKARINKLKAGSAYKVRTVSYTHLSTFRQIARDDFICLAFGTAINIMNKKVLIC